jgi:hypothetical protein
MLDPTGERLYYPFYERAPHESSTPIPGTGGDAGPWPLQLAALDLDTGLEIARTTVPGVFAGSWQVESIGQMYVGAMETPGIALSPDGSQIAVVDADLETLALLDTGTLAVTGTHTIHEPESITHRLLGWLGLTPQTAQAKVSEGRVVRASFSADARHLYLHGYEMEVGETLDEIAGHGFGLMRVEATSGEITAKSLAGHDPETVMVTADGQFIYALRPKEPWWDNAVQNPNYVLHRLDARTLESLDERQFGSWPQIMMVPIGRDLP